MTQGSEAKRMTRDLGDLYATNRRDLSAYFRRHGRHADADDMTQEVFLRFARGGYPPRSDEARAILFSIARNLFNDELRRLQRTRKSGLEHEPDTPLDDYADIEGLGPTPERTLAGKQELRATLAAIESLPDQCRRVFRMHRFEGLTHKEIAAALGISKSAVEKHIMGAVLRLLEMPE